MSFGLFLSILVTFSGAVLAQPTLPTVTSICENLDGLQAGDWLILDLDGTVITEAQVLGRDQWFERKIKSLVDDHGLTNDEAWAWLRPISAAAKKMSGHKLTEDCLSPKIRAAQARGVGVFAITGRPPKMRAETIRTLRRLGVDFGYSPLPHDVFSSVDWAGLHDSVTYFDGVFFTGGCDKGQVLRQILRSVKAPRHIRAFDDQEKNVRSFNKMFALQKLNGDAFQVTGSATSLVDMKIGDVELHEFLRRNSRTLMSDDEALLSLSPSCALTVLDSR